MKEELKNLFNEYLQESNKNSNEIIWDEEPVTFKEFLYSNEHMNFPPYSDRQMDVMDFMFGDEPKKIFENEHSLSILIFGKGCLDSNTILEDAFTHKKYTVKELCDNKISIYLNCYDEINKKSTIEKASIPWISGHGKIYRVETESGKKIDVFLHHEFYTKDGWKKLSDLCIGDYILDDFNDYLHIINKIIDDFNNSKINREEKSVKNFLINKLDELNIYNLKGNRKRQSIYCKCLYEIMGKEWKNKKFGMQKEKHPLWGTHQSEESKKKNSDSNRKSLRALYNSEKGNEVRRKISKKVSGKNNPMYGKPAPHGSGKCKYFKFKNITGKEFYLQGKWELKFAEFLNDKNINWEKNFDRFEYKTKDGIDHTYCPDFKLFFNNSELYIEIKGMEDEYVNTKLEAVRKCGKKIYIIRQDIFRKFYNNYETPILKYDKIKSIKFLKEDNYYDLEIDKYHNYLAHGLYNHNSGKDTMSVHATLYVIYVLLCCKNPLSLFKGVTADYLDILNVAYNHQQAISVFMAKLVLAVKNWKWLKNKYKFVDSGRSIKDDKKYETMDIVNIKQDKIIFPKYIRAMAKCSQQNAAEGTNLLVWIADEFSAFSDKNNKSNAMEMFNTLRTSSTTRFQNYGKGFVISFTRYKNDPILKLAEMYKDDINTYVDIASTFEVKPRSAFQGEWGEWNGIKMPISFIADFERDPEGSKAKYLCQPPDSEDPWITETHLLEQSFHDRAPMFEFKESISSSVGGNMIHKHIIKKNFNLPNTNFILAGDLGRVNDRSALTLFHDESIYLPDGSIRKHYVQDFMLTWIPDKKDNKKVDFTNVEYIIKKLIFEYKLSIINVVFDNWQSATLMDELANKGIIGKQYVLKAEDFTRFKTLLYTDAIDLLKDSAVEEEMKRLVNGQRGIPDHHTDEHDDRFRAICLAITALEGFKGTDMVVTEDGIFLKGIKKMNKVGSAEDTGDIAKTRGLHNPGEIDDDGIFKSLNIVNDLK